MSIESLLQRRSVVAKLLTEPGPDEAELEQILRAAIRVPDHKALSPWRFILFSGKARAVFGKEIAQVYAKRHENENPGDKQLDLERHRLLRAPMVIAVISSPKESEAVPEIEQLLSAGAACQNILHAAHALGFGAQWLTEWFAYDADVREIMELRSGESIAGFIYIGSMADKPGERARAALETVVSHWGA